MSENIGLIDEKDRLNLKKLIEYLEGLNLKVEIRGSATQSREYADIDLLVTGDPEMIAAAITGLKGYSDERMGRKIEPFSQKYRLSNYNVRQVAGRNLHYVLENVDYRFLIAYNDTFFDVSLKVKK